MDFVRFLFAIAWVGISLGQAQAQASDFPNVDADLKVYDQHVAKLNLLFSQLPADSKDKDWVRRKLSHMFEVDQYMRVFAMNTPFEKHYSDGELHYFQTQMGPRWLRIDASNTADLKPLLQSYTWFKISEFGAQADQHAWILVQHADRDPGFQRQVLAILEGLWRTGETSPSNYAYLFDRVAVSWNDPTQAKAQRFGTQGTCTGPGIWQPSPIEHPENLDQRRKEMGLEPHADYVARFKEICR